MTTQKEIFDNIVKKYTIGEPYLDICSTFVKSLPDETVLKLGNMEEVGSNEKLAEHFFNITKIQVNTEKEINIAAGIIYICNKT